MKEGWEIRKLGEVATFQRGLTYSKNDEVEYSDNAVLRSNNVDLETNKLDLSEIKYISEKIIIPKDKKIKNGSLLICMANGSKSHLGKVALINIDNDFAFGGFMGLIVPDNNMVSSCYLYYSMITPMYKRFIKGLSDGANINNLKFSDLQKFNIPVPPLSEQQRIVSKLDSAFEKIDALKANAENNLKNAKDLFQQVLKKELETKDGWKTMKLGDVCSIISGYAFDSKGYSNKKDDILLVCGDNIVHCGFRWETVKRWDKNKFDELSRFSIRENDIVLAMDRPWVKSGLKIAKVSKKELPSLLIQRTACIRTDEKVSNDYIYIALQNDCFSKYLIGQQTGVGVPHISGKQIMNYELSMPNLNEQQRIVSILDSLSDKCRRLEENYRKTAAECDALKQAVLREVMSVE